MKKTLIAGVPYGIPEKFKGLLSGGTVYDSSCSPEARVYFIDKQDGFYLKIADGGRLHGLQEVKMISFNIERIAAQTPGGVLGDVMREVIPGSFRGTVEFTAQPAWCHLNEVNFKLWEEDGSGSGFVTRNVCHKTVCTTEERLSYYPSPGQQIYDTDLNKILICTDPAKRKWVDALGVEV